MGHIVFAAPDIQRFHLFERLRRELVRRGHRVAVLCTERAGFTFWREQATDVDLLADTRRVATPTDAVDDDALESLAGGRERRAALRNFGAARRWLEREQPDLLLFGGERSADHTALQAAARATHRATLWFGDGLLPHTLQLDEHGVDGASSCRRWGPADYRVVTPDDALLQASLAHALAMTEPTSLPRAPVHVPLASRRLLDALAYAVQARPSACWRALNGWQQALPPLAYEEPAATDVDLCPPYLAVLLQREDDVRVRLDGGDAPTPERLLAAARGAADQLGAGLVAVLPEGRAGLRWRRLARAAAARGVPLLRAASAPVIAATAQAVVTVHHPLAAVGLLAGTPVIHTGRALYDLQGVTTTATVDDLPAAVAAACQRDRPALRRRFLTWQLRYGHLWCSPSSPNHNGVLGLAQAVEQSLERGAPRAGDRPRYRPGPTWPLAKS